MTEKKRVIAFDYYDPNRLNPVKVKVRKVKKGRTFKIQDVTYKITKVFKEQGERCVEIKMVAYKIPNTNNIHVHKCPARKGLVMKMKPEDHKKLEKKFGKKTVEGWKDGRVKMRGDELATVCPDCGVVFWKEKHEAVPEVEVVSLKGKKPLKKRK